MADVRETKRCSAGVIEAGLVALVSGALATYFLRRGIGISPDGWGYWQASVSLMNGNGMTDLLGEPVVDWPPGFPLYLAAWQALLGTSGATLVAATVACVGAAGFLWTLLLFRVMAPERSHWTWLSLAWLVCVLPTAHGFLLSEMLFHALLPGVLLISHHTWACTDRRPLLLSAAGLGAALGALLLVRNASISLVPALLFPLLLQARVCLRWRVFGIALATSVAGCVALASRAWFDQGASHVVGWGVGYLTAGEYGEHISVGLANHLSSGALGAVLLTALALTLAIGRGFPAESIARVRLWGGVTCVACLGLFVLFNMVQIGNPPRGRFTLFATLMVIPLALTLLQQLRPRILGVAIAVLFLFAPITRVWWLIPRGSVPAELAIDTRPVPQAIGLDVSLVAASTASPQRIDGTWYVGPPSRALWRGNHQAAK